VCVCVCGPVIHSSLEGIGQVPVTHPPTPPRIHHLLIYWPARWETGGISSFSSCACPRPPASALNGTFARYPKLDTLVLDGRKRRRLARAVVQYVLIRVTTSLRKKSMRLFMVALWNRADHYIFIVWFLSSSIYLFSSPNLSRRKLDVYHTFTHGVALVRI